MKQDELNRLVISTPEIRTVYKIFVRKTWGEVVIWGHWRITWERSITGDLEEVGCNSGRIQVDYGKV